MASNRLTVHGSDLDTVAENGLLHRRMLLTAGIAAAAAVAGAALPDPAAADALPVEPWMKLPGSGFAGYGQPSKFESKVARTFASLPGTTGTGAARTPHHLLDGMITPNGVHFERSHSGIPDINPETHRLLIHGLVKRPLVFTLESLGRYPRESRVAFLECGGNGQLLYQKEPAPVGVQAIHGLVSCAEWTGVKLAVLLQEAGVDPKAKWILAEGADAAGMSRSIPVAKAMDDALIALYQNGERVRPSNGYPMRLLLPGIRRQHEREMASAHQADRKPDDDQGRDIEVHDHLARREIPPICTSSGRQFGDYPAFAGADHERTRPLRNLRSCLVGLWQGHQGRGFGRRRQELGGGGAATAGAVEGLDALPHSVAVERRAGGPAKPRH
jgi:DMSO/TMAO reductase YedYZ molybdopterin-dependent catalytic subunit